MTDLNVVTLILCDACLDGVGGECHTPGCSLWMSRAPDIPIRENGTVFPLLVEQEKQQP